MSDLIRGFRAQLTMSMDSNLRRAVFEIMMIFENSLHEYQMELGHKGEEVAQLKMKLQRAEIRLTEIECVGSRGTEVKKGGTEDVVNAPKPTDDVPEIDFEVPDDWCAPLACETVTREEYVCPSVRLRRLSIPLSQISIKQEVDQRDIDSNQRAKGVRRSRRGSLINKKTTQDKTIPTHDQGTQHPTQRNDIKQLLSGIKQVHTDTTIGTSLSKGGIKGKKQKHTKKSKGEENKIVKSESTEKEIVKNRGEKKYSCRYCKKGFDTMFGRSVHIRSHKKCKGCKREFPSPSALKLHKPSCIKLKKLLAKKDRSTNPPKPESLGEENLTAQQVIIKKESTASSSRPSESSTQNNKGNKKITCVHCNKTCRTSLNLEEHLCVHAGEKKFPCSMCSKPFQSKKALREHKRKMHKEQNISSETNESNAWTMPLENMDDISVELKSPEKEKSHANNHEDVQRDNIPDTSPSLIWETMGTRSPEGFICRLCLKPFTDTHGLIEHFPTHTGEKPFQCNVCSERFSNRAQLGGHEKMCWRRRKCSKCMKTFPSIARCNKHVLICGRDHTCSCEVCGKSFVHRACLRNHMERLHNTPV
ncbi:zinc finger protein 26-like [Trematomus bernacchii]|uniref:zinc finger protein 26-like n=1 Tax=Trematomus bernacchii TaxID=40690 RepID=UPI00146C5DEC|nr:zinc finger protein 26-like [Trematomus bernacchii]